MKYDFLFLKCTCCILLSNYLTYLRVSIHWNIFLSNIHRSHVKFLRMVQKKHGITKYCMACLKCDSLKPTNIRYSIINKFYSVYSP